MLDKSVSLLINSKEQIIVEKLKSLLKFGITPTRYFIPNLNKISKYDFKLFDGILMKLTYQVDFIRI